MKTFATREELDKAYVEHLVVQGYERSLAEEMVVDKARYNPLKYRGGWAIREFGYSTERLGILEQTGGTVGNPELV